jgi:hypothetical protein
MLNFVKQNSLAFTKSGLSKLLEVFIASFIKAISNRYLK